MEYKGLIFTNHIIQRMKERNLRMQDIHWIFNHPDEVHDTKADSGRKYYRNYKGTRYAVVAKKNKEGKWVLLTCWWKDLDNKKYKAKKQKIGFFTRAWKMISGR